MGNKTSTLSTKRVPTEVNKKQSGLDLVENAFFTVIHNYVRFLLQISVSIIRNHTQNIEIKKRKFHAVRKELFQLLFEHRMFFKLKTINFSSKNGSISHTLSASSAGYELFLKLDDFFEVLQKLSSLKELSRINYSTDLVKQKIMKRIKIVLDKTVITDEDIHIFLDNHFLVDKFDLKSNCSNYKELNAYIYNRRDSYYKKTVSVDHIDKISFKFLGSIKDFEDQKSCCVCLEDYEKDQEICHLPCNHFCCKKCTVKMFAVPQNGSKANFQCPMCRADCT